MAPTLLNTILTTVNSDSDDKISFNDILSYRHEKVFRAMENEFRAII
jgi:hypothetical protein